MEIWRNRQGVAHVEGKDSADALSGMGYAHGKDRAMQLLLMRVLGQGRGSELLDAGDTMLQIDLFFRRMNWHANTAAEIEKFPARTLDLCTAYCDGVNTALSEKIPWEFKLLGYRPEPWRVEDIILLSRMMGYLTLAQSQGEMERLFIEMVQAGVDEQKLHDLFPGILGGLDIELIRQVRLEERIVNPASLWNTAAPLMMASNNWVISGKKTASGKPILANDPHLELNRLPSVWYEMVLKTPDGYALGATLPGAPGFPIGRNSKLAWGATYTFMDATDSWIENCKDGKYFREPDQWMAFHKRVETVLRKKKPPMEKVFYENDHGVLEGDPFTPGYYLTTAWAPAASGAISIINFLNLLTADTVEQGMRLLGAVETAWNFVLADSLGNIGYQMSGRMPKRREGVSGFVPLPGWKAENDWQGFEALEDLPRCINPECGFIVTANQDLNHLGRVKPLNAMMGSYRADRIAALLSSEENRITCEDMFKIHYDVYSLQAEAFMKILSPLLPDTPAGMILKQWDFTYTTDSKGAWLFERFYKALHHEVFGENGLGRAVVDHLDQQTGIFNDFYLNFDRVLLAENSAWFNGQTREAIYAETAEKALAVEPKKWGDCQKLMLTHILFDGRLPGWLGFDRGPVTLPGNRATIHQGQIYESAGRKTSFAPSYRMVTDLSTVAIHTNLAGGPSDRRFSKWYCSDLQNWKNKIYKRLCADDPGPRLRFK